MWEGGRAGRARVSSSSSSSSSNSSSPPPPPPVSDTKAASAPTASSGPIPHPVGAPGSSSSASASSVAAEEQDEALVPELDPTAKAEKERSKKIIMDRMLHNKWSDAMRAGKEKRWVAEPVLRTGEEAFPFPALEVHPLLFTPDASFSVRAVAEAHAATLVTFSMQGVGKEQLRPVHRAFLDAFSESPGSGVLRPGLQLMDITYVSGLAPYLLRWAMLGGIRAAVWPELRSYSFVKFERNALQTEQLCFDLGLHNWVMGWSFLLDPQARVRWVMHSTPADGELAHLIAATNLLRAESAQSERR